MIKGARVQLNSSWQCTDG